MSLLTLLVPLVATTGAVLFLDEPIDGLQWLGMAVVLVALAEVVRRTSRPRPPTPVPAPAPVAGPAPGEHG